MHIELRTDSNIAGSQALRADVEAWIERRIAKHATRLTGIEVHLSDVNGDKHTPGDKVCRLEARIRGRQPTVVSENADSIRTAVSGAAAKLDRALEKEFGRLAEY